MALKEAFKTAIRAKLKDASFTGQPQKKHPTRKLRKTLPLGR